MTNLETFAQYWGILIALSLVFYVLSRTLLWEKVSKKYQIDEPISFFSPYLFFIQELGKRSEERREKRKRLKKQMRKDKITQFRFISVTQTILNVMFISALATGSVGAVLNFCIL